MFPCHLYLSGLAMLIGLFPYIVVTLEVGTGFKGTYSLPSCRLGA